MSSAPPPIAIVNVQHAGTTLPFAYPDAGNTRPSLDSIFTGREYPLVPFDGYVVDVIVDIGANIGAAGVYFHLHYPSARVVCFEPSPSSFKFLQRNLGGRANVELHPIGLSDRAGQARLFTGTDHCMQNSMMRSIETSETFETVEVRRASEEFDRLGISHVSILKVDTEGCELPILRDLRSLLETVDQLYIESHSEDDRRAIDALLAEHFVLMHGRVTRVHRGSFLYFSRRMLRLCPHLEEERITPI